MNTQELHERIDSFRALADGWMPGAKAIQPEIVDAVHDWLERFNSLFPSQVYIYPDGDGGVLAELGQGTVYLTFAFESAESATIRSSHDCGEDEDERIDVRDDSATAKRLEWFKRTAGLQGDKP